MVKGSYYPGDDVKQHKVRDSKKPKQTKLRKSITPGTILIVLAGRFKGRRVVCLKQLQSGLLLVTGPYKLNGVPLRRLNQAYVQATSTKVELNGVNTDTIDDSYFTKRKQKIKKDNDMMVFNRNTEKTEEDKKNIEEKKNKQLDFDKAVLESVKKVEMLDKYLSTRFTLRRNMKPHMLKY